MGGVIAIGVPLALLCLYGRPDLRRDRVGIVSGEAFICRTSLWDQSVEV